MRFYGAIFGVSGDAASRRKWRADRWRIAWQVAHGSRGRWRTGGVAGGARVAWQVAHGSRGRWRTGGARVAWQANAKRPRN